MNILNNNNFVVLLQQIGNNLNSHSYSSVSLMRFSYYRCNNVNFNMQYARRSRISIFMCLFNVSSKFFFLLLPFHTIAFRLDWSMNILNIKVLSGTGTFLYCSLPTMLSHHEKGVPPVHFRRTLSIHSVLYKIHFDYTMLNGKRFFLSPAFHNNPNWLLFEWAADLSRCCKNDTFLISFILWSG